MIGNYGELQLAIAGWLGTRKYDAQIPDFIALCEAAFTRALRIMIMEASVDLALSAERVDFPDAFRGVRRLYLDTVPLVLLRYVTPEQLGLTYGGSATGQPRVYTLLDGQFVFGPAPDGAYVGKLVFWKGFTPLSGASPVNDMLVRHPDLYLFGSLCKAESYLQNDPRMVLWKNEYAGIIAEIIAEDVRDRASGTVLAPMSYRPFPEAIAR